MEDEPITEGEKIRIVSDFILHAPPGEFNEVFNDVRILVNDDNLLKDGCTGAFSKYNKDQFTPVSLTDNAEERALVTEFADLGKLNSVKNSVKNSVINLVSPQVNLKDCRNSNSLTSYPIKRQWQICRSAIETVV